MPKIVVKGIQLHYEKHGQGNILILISGLNCDSRIWRFILDDLKEHFLVIFLDNRGVGRSDCPDTSCDIKTFAEDVFGLMTALHIEKAHVLGHSMGGAIAQTMGYLHPERIRKLIICNSLIKVHWINRLLGRSWIFLRQNGFVSQTMMEKVMPFLFSKNFRKDKKRVNEIIHSFLSNTKPNATIAFKRQFEALCSFDSTNWLKEIQVPTLIVEGEEDLFQMIPKD